MAPPELAVLFIDMDAYYASCEQMDRPELRERPIAVTPVMTGTGCCIACSYEARPYGVRTGCSVRDARRLCPHIEIVQARPDFYIETHHALQRAIDTVIPVTEVESIDECRCHLMVNERHPDAVAELGLAIKWAIFQSVGPMTCCGCAGLGALSGGAQQQPGAQESVPAESPEGRRLRGLDAAKPDDAGAPDDSSDDDTGAGADPDTPTDDGDEPDRAPGVVTRDLPG